MKRRTITSLICVLAAVSGYLLALPRQAVTPETTGNSSPNHRISSRIPDRDPVNSPNRKRRDSSEIEALKSSLLDRLKQSPNAWNDWPLRRQIASTVSALSASELKELAMSLHETGSHARFIPLQENHRATLLREILLQWSLLDPAAAITCQAQHSLTSGSSMFNAWRNRAPDEAQAWLFSDDHPEELKKTVENLRFSEISALGSTDFNAAISQWDHVTPQQQRQLLQSWGKILLNDPAKRDQVLAKIASLTDRNAAFSYYDSLVRAIADKDPSQTAELVGKLEVDETQRAKLNDAVFAGWMKKEPAAALDHWVGLGQDKLPREVAQGFADWLNMGKTMKSSADWLENVPPGPARSALEKEAVSGYISYDHHHIAAKVALNIGDADLRAEQLNIVHRRWLEAHPESARKWTEGLSESDRALLSK
jgi:hypothetical protein